MKGVTELPEGRNRALQEAVARRRDELVELACELVRRPSTLGHEEPTQALVDERLRAMGFDVERIEPDPDAAFADPYAGYPFLPYDGRSSVAARLRGSGGGQSIHLTGHVDVVPVERPDLWGRGAGDMKGGLAAYLVAAAAVAEVCDDRRGDLLFSSVIEEECGGNGMWSVLRGGYEADAVLIGESSALS